MSRTHRTTFAFNSSAHLATLASLLEVQEVETIEAQPAPADDIAPALAIEPAQPAPAKAKRNRKAKPAPVDVVATIDASEPLDCATLAACEVSAIDALENGARFAVSQCDELPTQ